MLVSALGLISRAAPTATHPERLAQGKVTQTVVSRSGSSAPTFSPEADPKAVVTLGRARFTVLTPELIRLEWAADGKFEDHASLVFLNRRLPLPVFEYRVAEGNRQLTLKTRALTVTYAPGSDGRFTPETLTIRLKVVGKPVFWHPGLKDPQNLLGTTATLDGVQGDGVASALEPGLVSRSGWALVDDSARPLFDSADFSFRRGEKSPWPWVLARPAGERQDWYFFGYGHDYRHALADYVQVAGRIPLPPRFAFGAWWSRYWAYSDQELNELVRGFRENDIPLDVLVIDMDWHVNQDQLKAAGQVDRSGQVLGWTGYTWNSLLFPDPAAFLAQLHRDGLKATLNLHPASGVQPWEGAYPAMAHAMGLDPATKAFVPFDITDKRYAVNYLNLLHHPLERQGIDFWWLDWQQELKTTIPGVNTIWWLNYVHFTDQQREGKRPLLFHRWGGLGNHRYQIGFSGDTISVWESLAFQPWFTATAANVGYAYWSHDIGGHMPGAVDPELFTRWLQFGAFSPILRTHTTKNPEAERRPWAYAEPYSSILRSAIQLRYALQPYLYTEGRRTYDTGVAFLRPLYYDWPEEDLAYQCRGEYVFGDQMVVQPVVAAADPATGVATQRLWLPPGDWIEWPTEKRLTGPASMERRFSIDQTPVYVRAGAIVPMQPPMRYSGEKAVDPLIVNLWPLTSGAESSYSVYEDAGDSVDYQRGVFARTPIHARQSGDRLRVTIGPVAGQYRGMPQERGYEIRLPADWPPQTVTVNGAPVRQALKSRHAGWRFEGNTLTTSIPTGRAPVSATVIVEVRRAPGLIERRGELDGFSGSMTRLRAAYDSLRQTWPVTDAMDELIDAMQTGTRLSYHPQRALVEISHLHELLPRLPSALASLGVVAVKAEADLVNDAATTTDDTWRDFAQGLVRKNPQRAAALVRAQSLLQDVGAIN